MKNIVTMSRIVYSALHFTKRLNSGFSGKIRYQKYVLTKYFQGEPKKSDFKIVDEELPELKNGEILTEAEFLSVDPYMRAYMIGYKLPTDMIGGQVAKIISSRNEKFPVGSYVAGQFGWRTHTVCDPESLDTTSFLPLTVLPDFRPHPISLALGILGMPGNTAYFGLKEICNPKSGETVVITGAAGAVGSHVGQIAKIMGCRVIGFAGSLEKCEYLEKELGFDRAYNYKTDDIKAALRDGAPKRVDCYFDNARQQHSTASVRMITLDNRGFSAECTGFGKIFLNQEVHGVLRKKVGGEISSTIMSHMNKFGRVAVCGSISSYNDVGLPKVTIVQPAIVFKELKVEGFVVNRWCDRWNEGIETNLKWLREGKLKYKEKVYYGFDNMVDALVGILRGENTGKAVVKVK